MVDYCPVETRSDRPYSTASALASALASGVAGVGRVRSLGLDNETGSSNTTSTLSAAGDVLYVSFVTRLGFAAVAVTSAPPSCGETPSVTASSIKIRPF